MAKFTMLIGIPASGKSSYTSSLSEGRILSSDLIRKAILGDRQDQNHQGLIFDLMNRQTKLLLEEGHDVYYDATNISSKRRMALLKTLPKDSEKVALFFSCPLELAIKRDDKRDYSEQVGEEVITRMYKSLDVPMVHEGFDTVEYIHVKDFSVGLSSGSRELQFMNNIYLKSYSHYCNTFLTGEVDTCVDFAQDNPHHTFSVSRHMFKTIEGLGEDASLRLRFAAALHDCGKPSCRAYKDDGYACFYGHDKVSAQMAVHHMLRQGFKTEDIYYISTLINLHMRLHQKEGKEKLKNLVGLDMYKELELLHEADSNAK